MGLIWHEGPWRVGVQLCPLQGHRAGGFSSPSGAQTGATVGLLGDARPIFRLVSMVRTVLFFVGSDGWGVGGEGQASSGLVGAFSSGAPILFEPVSSLHLPEVYPSGSPGLHKASRVPEGEMGSRAGQPLVESQHSPNSKSTLCPALQVTCQLHAVLIWGKKKNHSLERLREITKRLHIASI